MKKMIGTSNLIANPKARYYKGNKLLDLLLGATKYWSIVNSFPGEKKMATIPPLLDNGEVVTTISLKLMFSTSTLSLNVHPLLIEMRCLVCS